MVRAAARCGARVRSAAESAEAQATAPAQHLAEAIGWLEEGNNSGIQSLNPGLAQATGPTRAAPQQRGRWSPADVAPPSRAMADDPNDEEPDSEGSESESETEEEEDTARRPRPLRARARATTHRRAS